MLAKAGVYKAIWHNSYSYLKAKSLKYRLRILDRKEINASAVDEASQIEDLFTINDLTETESKTFRALRAIYPDFVPIVRIVRDPQVRRINCKDLTIN